MPEFPIYMTQTVTETYLVSTNYFACGSTHNPLFDVILILCTNYVTNFNDTFNGQYLRTT